MVWDPHTASGAYLVERIQRRAARFVKRDYSRQSSVTQMLNELGWRPLAQRRADARLCMLYQIDRSLVAIPKTQYLIPVTRYTRHSHSRAFLLPLATKNTYKYSYFPRTIRLWNSLPAHVVDLPTLDSFRGAVCLMTHPTP